MQAVSGNNRRPVNAAGASRSEAPAEAGRATYAEDTVRAAGLANTAAATSAANTAATANAAKAGAANAANTAAAANTGKGATSSTANAANAEAGEGAGFNISDYEDLQALEEQIGGDIDELALARAEVDELRDRYARLQAEWDNFRKRTSAERESERKRAAANLVEKLLPVIDDLERAIEHGDTASAASLSEGIQAVYAKFKGALSKEGVVTIDPLGKPFDANFHSAMGTVVNASFDEETVVQVYQKGYEMAGRLLRPAMVIVSTK